MSTPPANFNLTTSAQSHPVDRKTQVRDGYDIVAKPYLNFALPRPTSTRLHYLDKLISLLPHRASILELGCGAGKPCTEYLLGHDKQFQVTAVDISASQIELAREYIPRAELIHADMTELQFEQQGRTFDAVLAFYSIFHLPQDEQGPMIGKVSSWLKDGGWLLCNFSCEKGDVVLDGWLDDKVNMFYSSLGIEGNRDIFKGDVGGLKVVEDEVAEEIVGRYKENFHWIMAKRSL